MSDLCIYQTRPPRPKDVQHSVVPGASKWG